ncbi:MAG: RlmE family RNA methyltransferase [Bacteriovoracaceae bacterium]|nr:RlmE family RNA methyltransferase [Bacteriovoracaceae bacterium]
MSKLFKVKDHFYKKAKKENFLARSIYKLEEIDQQYKILKPGNLVLDLGYYPGSWIQYTSAKVVDGQVVGIDIQEVNPKLASLPNVKLMQKDIDTVRGISDLGVGRKFDVVLSDMAPSTTGVKMVDQARSLNLVEMVFGLLLPLLERNGNMVAKVFDSHDAQVFLKTQKKRFKDFNYLKPKSTRSISKEFFVIGKGFLGE